MPITLKSLILKVYDFEPETIGEHILKKRLELGLRQKDVSKLIGVDQFTILNWEKNKNQPMTQHIPKIINFLGYNPISNTPSNIPELLKARRIEHGLSQKQAARMLGVDESTWARWERGRRMGDPEQRKRVASFIGLPEKSVHEANCRN